MKMKAYILLIFLSLGLNAAFGQRGQNTLLYFDGQGIIGYNHVEEDVIYYSHHILDAMQKPSLGMDWLQRFSSRHRDIGILALQFRWAYDRETRAGECQLYNAWFKYKSPAGDIWAGHGKPAAGASSWLDNHALLLPDMTMYGFIFDRDWGGGYSKDTDWGNLSLSLTTGSGMRLYNKDGNFLAAGHVSYGVLNKDNFTLGATFLHGKVLEAMGYNLLHGKKLHRQTMSGFDAALRYNNLETMLDTYIGKFYPAGNPDEANAWGLLWRSGINLLEEERLKPEVQIHLRELLRKHHTEAAAGITWKLHPDWTLRLMYARNIRNKDQKTVAQIYYYISLL